MAHRTQVAVWQLADDEDAYGAEAGWFILTSPDGETEMDGGPWPTAEQAVDRAAEMGWAIVPATFVSADGSTRCRACQLHPDECTCGADHPLRQIGVLPATNRPGDMAAVYAQEAGVSYEQALVACNMD